jgi:hypothetical protein
LEYIFTTNSKVLVDKPLSAKEFDALVANAEFALNGLHPEIKLGHLLRILISSGSVHSVALSKEVLRQRPSMVKLLLVALFESVKFKNKASQKANLLLIRNSNKYHFKSLIDPVYKQFELESDLMVHSEKSFNGRKHKGLYYPTVISEVFKSLYLAWRYSKGVNHLLGKMGFLIPSSAIRFELFKNLMTYFSALKICNQRGYKIVLVDTDRGNVLASAFCLAASQLGVKSATLQHGAIDMVYGYYPVLAKEIWCWGNFQKKLLIDAGLAEDRVLNKGNPVAQLRPFKEDMAKVIGFGLSGGHVIEIEKNIIFWLLEQDSLRDFDFMIKIRPSQAVLPWMLSSPRLSVYETEARTDANSKFFEQIDLLIITISSIGPEAVASGVPLWVYKMSVKDPQLDTLLVITGFFPNISDPLVLSKEAISLKERGTEYLKQLWLTQNNFIMNDYYCAVGDKAVENICESIKQEIRDSN